jgi:hypothetical protein
MHDVIIVGARVAGSATALLLAGGLNGGGPGRSGDTPSTHQVQVPGVARLALGPARRNLGCGDAAYPRPALRPVCRRFHVPYPGLGLG